MKSVIVFGHSDSVWNMAQILFPPELEIETLKSRFKEQVLKKDEEGINLIDCCILRRKNTCAEFFKALLHKISADHEHEKPSELKYDFPQLYIIETCPRVKDRAQIKEEKDFWKKQFDMVTRYGGDLSKKNKNRIIHQ